VSAEARREPRWLPTPVGLGAEWYAHLARGELRFQRCDACGNWRHPPRHLCPACGSEDWSWQPVRGRGAVFSWTITHQALHPGFAGKLPYAVLIVELEEDVRVVCGARGLDNDDLALDLPVTIEIDRVNEELGLLYARPV
jgi:uncharacterized OB-fold protein